MKYTYQIQNLNTGETCLLTTFFRMEPDEILGWGKDDREPDGVARWKPLELVRVDEEEDE